MAPHGFLFLLPVGRLVDCVCALSRAVLPARLPHEPGRPSTLPPRLGVEWLSPPPSYVLSVRAAVKYSDVYPTSTHVLLPILFHPRRYTAILHTQILREPCATAAVLRSDHTSAHT